ncbi:rRNA small subunit 7-methylguanosine (m7G) methyltransferase GidB [Acidisarcina polymorpha]|uniref:Ribosomal RNA small subunit methyltransferase G n=2 Tax=Acidisarcina polymorpha TaxID=2211140 RepID=A0A2Z5FY10_9BACT|nr:rRNA small subunit 7-methylguanosine (m7G) methyltransferase GidB [Acidisarcina polymorpha]
MVAGAGLLPLSRAAAEGFSKYFELLQRWNAKLNLTAIRSNEEILRRHFLESIFCAQGLPEGVGTLLDFGSGAGFPGIPVALCRPEIQVTLAESQGKKASFLREAVRVLGLSAEVFGRRVEEMAPERRFGVVTLRAVDKMESAISTAAERVGDAGWLVVLASSSSRLPDEFDGSEVRIPWLEHGVVLTGRRMFHVEQLPADLDHSVELDRDPSK